MRMRILSRYKARGIGLSWLCGAAAHAYVTSLTEDGTTIAQADIDYVLTRSLMMN
jgi:hypothetical protein